MTLQKKTRRRDHIPAHPFVLVSLHRYENIFKKERFSQIIDHLERIALKHSLIFILHPPTEKQLRRFDFMERIGGNDNIEMRDRYHHSDFLCLLEQAEFVVTDGGSLQEESAYLGIPCLLLRKATERNEGLGENVVLSCYEKNIIDNFCDNYSRYRRQPLMAKYSPSDIVIESVLQYS